MSPGTLVELERLSPKGPNPLNVEKQRTQGTNHFLDVVIDTDFKLSVSGMSGVHKSRHKTTCSVPTMSMDSYTPGPGTAADILSMHKVTVGNLEKEPSDGFDHDLGDHEESEESNTLTLDNQQDTFGREGSLGNDLYQQEGSDDSSSPTAATMGNDFEIVEDKVTMH